MNLNKMTLNLKVFLNGVINNPTRNPIRAYILILHSILMLNGMRMNRSIYLFMFIE